MVYRHLDICVVKHVYHAQPNDSNSRCRTLQYISVRCPETAYHPTNDSGTLVVFHNGCEQWHAKLQNK